MHKSSFEILATYTDTYPLLKLRKKILFVNYLNT